MTYTPTTDEIEESYIYQQHDVNGRFTSAKEAGETFDRWHANEIRKAKVEVLEGVFKEINEQRAALPGYFIDVYGWFEIELKKLKGEL